MDGFGDAADGDEQRREAQGHVAAQLDVVHLGEYGTDLGVEPLVDDVARPVIVVDALHLLEVADDQAAGVGDDVRDDVDALEV